jgi:hypothetical protein
MCSPWLLRIALRGDLRSRSAPTCSNEAGRPWSVRQYTGCCKAARGRGKGGIRCWRVWVLVWGAGRAGGWGSKGGRRNFGGERTQGLRGYRSPIHNCTVRPSIGT